MKKIFIVVSLVSSLFVGSVTAADCIMVKDLNVEFKNDSTVYSNTAEKQKIIDFAKFMKETDVYALIEGHANSYSSALHNKDLSTRRAVKIMYKLRDEGVKASRVRAMGFGESSPLYDNNTREGLIKNRRIVAEVFNTAAELDGYILESKARVKDLILTER